MESTVIGDEDGHLIFYFSSVYLAITINSNLKSEKTETGNNPMTTHFFRFFVSINKQGKQP